MGEHIIQILFQHVFSLRMIDQLDCGSGQIRRGWRQMQSGIYGLNDFPNRQRRGGPLFVNSPGLLARVKTKT